MLASDAGFTYAGAKLSNEAENSADKRRQHRNLAYGSMAVGDRWLWYDALLA